MGVRKTTDFLEKATWTLAAAMIVLCVASAAFIPHATVTNKSAIEGQLQEAPVAQPAIPSFTDEAAQPANEAIDPEAEEAKN